MLSLFLSMKEKTTPLWSAELASRSGSQLEIPWRVHPSFIPSFWRKGIGHISPNSPSPFPRPQTKKKKKKEKVSQQLSRTPGSQETQSPHGLRSLPQQNYEDAQGPMFPFNILNRSSPNSFITTPIKKEKKKWRPLL